MINQNIQFENTNINLYGSSHGGQNAFGGSKSEFEQMNQVLNTNPEYIYVELPQGSVSDQNWKKAAESAEENPEYSNIPPEIMVIGKFVIDKGFPVQNIIAIDSKKARELNSSDASEDMVDISRSLRDSSMAYSIIQHINENKPRNVLVFIGENHISGLMDVING